MVILTNEKGRSMRRGGRTLSVSLRLGHAAALTATGCHSLPRRRFATSGGRLGARRPLPKGAEAPNGRYRDIGAPPRLRDSVRLRLSARSAPLPLRGTGRARKGKVFHKRKTVGFPLVWRSFRPFLSTWREKDIPFAAGPYGCSRDSTHTRGTRAVMRQRTS